ncbi:MAG: ATP-binding protein [Candidatus Gastranaerophilales bacterium]|nr:ATP-binding protein [Candidatus Gastranaerophilales bacterium]
MPKILLISDENKVSNNVLELLNDIGHEVLYASSEQESLNVALNHTPDIAIINAPCKFGSSASICKKLKLQVDNSDIQIILLIPDDSTSKEVLIPADGYIPKPFSDNILIATVNAHLRIKDLLNILYTNNRKLATSLFQLNTLYNTSSQLAGTLDKSKLIDIMNEGLEKTLNYSFSTVLLINSSYDITLEINSEHAISENLQEALKTRAVEQYCKLFTPETMPFEFTEENIKLKFNIKDESEIYDIDMLSSFSLFSDISANDKFFGTVEIIRNKEFKQEDITCFQTVVNQVALPLESAILYEEIKATNAKLEMLEKMKSEFISIVSHELRTPLTAIKNSLDIMLSGKTGEITKSMDNFLNMAKRNVGRLSGIINDLLDLSKIEAGKMKYRFNKMNVKEPIEFVKSTLENLAQKKDIEIELNIPPEIKDIYADTSRIEQILTNLISNAIKFTDDNGKIIISVEEISYKTASKNSKNKDNLLKTSHIKISVKDTGIGILNEDMPKVFDKFHQIETSLNRKVGGTGLGLPIAKQLVDAHRGKIWVESEPNKGSVFSFILPIISEENIFILELDNLIQQAKYSHSSVSLLTIEEKGENLLIKDIEAGNANIIRRRDDSKIFVQDSKMYILLPNLEKKNTSTIIKRIKNMYKTVTYSDNAVKKSVSIYPNDAITAEELIQHAKKSLKAVKF